MPGRASEVARRLRPTPAAVVGALAILVAMTGSALAVKQASVRSSHIQDGAVRSKELRQLGISRDDIGPDSVETGAMIDDSITGDDIVEEEVPHLPATTGPRGPVGPVGLVGLVGLTGQQGPDGDGESPKGPAGGDLVGSFPNPLIAPEAIGSAEILDGQINGNDLADALIDAAPNTASRRTLGNGPNQAAAGNDPRLSDNRPAADNSVTSGKVVDGSLRIADVAAFTQTVNLAATENVDPGECFSQVSNSADAYDDGDLVLVFPPPGTPTGLVATSFQAVDDQRLLRICNPTAATLTVPAGSVRFLVLRP